MHSRINWLKWGDRNTKFFHATTLQRRQRNRIRVLKDDDNMWVRDEHRLKELTQHFFSNLYKSDGQRDYGAILDQCPRIVTSEMNDTLTTEVTLEEFHKATF